MCGPTFTSDDALGESDQIACSQFNANKLQDCVFSVNPGEEMHRGMLIGTFTRRTIYLILRPIKVCEMVHTDT